jgi:hypothetical protein
MACPGASRCVPGTSAAARVSAAAARPATARCPFAFTDRRARPAPKGKEDVSVEVSLSRQGECPDEEHVAPLPDLVAPRHGADDVGHEQAVISAACRARPWGRGAARHRRCGPKTTVGQLDRSGRVSVWHGNCRFRSRMGWHSWPTNSRSVHVSELQGFSPEIASCNSPALRRATSAERERRWTGSSPVHLRMSRMSVWGAGG